MELMSTALLIDSLSVFQNLKKDPAIANLRRCILKLHANQDVCDQLDAVDAYANFCHALYDSASSGNLADYLFDLALFDVNPFSRLCAQGKYGHMEPLLKEAAKRDLGILCVLSTLSEGMMKSAFKAKFVNSADLIGALPSYSISHKRYAANGDWGENIDTFAAFYRQNGVGMYARYRAFVFEDSLLPLGSFDPVRFYDLKEYAAEQERVIENTQDFLAGRPYHDVLLYGDRGTGKSSTVKALLNEYGDAGLRMVELSNRSLAKLPRLFEVLREAPLHYIILIDDLTLHEDDESFSVFKAALEGSLGGRPKHVAVYATSNRRHLVKETFSAREGDELHLHDTIDETMSLSDRFGLTVTFCKPDRSRFLEIVRQLAADREIEAEEQVLLEGAEQFALKKGNRSPRVAGQYIDSLVQKEQRNRSV